MKNMKSGNLIIKISNANKKIKVEWLGKSDKRDPIVILNPYLENLANELKGKNVEVIFVNLKYMNSSTVPPIIQFMKNLDSRVLKATFLYAQDSNWQAASFKALKTLSKNMKNIEVESV